MSLGCLRCVWMSARLPPACLPIETCFASVFGSAAPLCISFAVSWQPDLCAMMVAGGIVLGVQGFVGEWSLGVWA